MIYWVAMIGSVAGFLFGYDEGIIAGSIDLVQEAFGLTHTDVGVMASALPFGALIGSMVMGAFLASHWVKRWGRRSLLSCAGLLFFIGALGAAASQSIMLLVVSRFVLGLAIGAASVTTPLYLAETAPEKIRGAMVAMYQLAITLGIVCAYLVNYALIDQKAWRLMFATSALPALILLIGMRYLPESPRWLLSVGRKKRAWDALSALRAGHAIEAEWNHIVHTLSQEPKQGHWRSLFSKPLLPVLVLGMMLFCLQQLSGINVIIYYAPEIFKHLGFDNKAGQILATLGIGGVNVLVTVLSLFYLDRIGRRKLLLFGFAGTSLSLLVMSYFSLHPLPGLGMISVACLSVYIFSYAISIGPVPHIAMSEIFPLHVRGAGMGLSAMSNWGFNTLMVFSFPLMSAHMGIAGTFEIYAIVCVLGFFYTLYCMPETKHLSLESIEDYLMSGHSLHHLGRGREGSALPEKTPCSEVAV